MSRDDDINDNVVCPKGRDTEMKGKQENTSVNHALSKSHKLL